MKLGNLEGNEPTQDVTEDDRHIADAFKRDGSPADPQLKKKKSNNHILLLYKA